MTSPLKSRWIYQKSIRRSDAPHDPSTFPQISRTIIKKRLNRDARFLRLTILSTRRVRRLRMYFIRHSQFLFTIKIILTSFVIALVLIYRENMIFKFFVDVRYYVVFKLRDYLVKFIFAYHQHHHARYPYTRHCLEIYISFINSSPIRYSSRYYLNCVFDSTRSRVLRSLSLCQVALPILGQDIFML